MTDLTIVLTTFNRQKSLEMTLASLENQTIRDFEVNIVDDFSDDGTYEFCKDYIFSSNLSCRYIRLEKQGYNLPRLRNLGVEFARGKYIVCLDDDIIATPNLIREYLSHFRKDQNQIYLGSLLYIKSENLHEITLEDIKNQRFDMLNRMLISSLDPRNDFLKGIELCSKVWIGNLGIKKSIFCSLNGIDEDFDSWGGLDEDFGLRLIRSSYKISLLDDCAGYHMGTNFKPLSEIAKELGVKLFREHKRQDINLIRNTIPKMSESYPVIVLFDGNRFHTDLRDKE